MGPATAIGQDYRALAMNRVVELRQADSEGQRFYMKLLKIEVGQLALQVLGDDGNIHAETLKGLRGTSMSTYGGPEDCRVPVRRRQSQRSKLGTEDILEALRGGQVD